MDPQTFDYWLPQGSYMPPHQTTIFELPPELSKVPSLSGSPVCTSLQSHRNLHLTNGTRASSTYDSFPAPLQPQGYYPQIADESMQFGSYPLPMTPSDFGSDHDSPYCSPRPLHHAEPVFAQAPASGSVERTHTTSGRRRAQNRAAQRAFRERKEKHARDLETQLASLTEKYNKLEVSHTELNAAYEKLRKTIVLLTQDDDAEGEEEDGKTIRRRNSNSERLRRMVEILHGDYKGGIVKGEST